MLQQDPEIITGGPVIWWINLSSSAGSLRFVFVPALRSGLTGRLQMCLFLQNQWSFREQPSVQHPPAASRALTRCSMGTTSSNLHSPAPSHELWLRADTGASRAKPFGAVSCWHAGLGRGLPWSRVAGSSPASSPSIFLRPSGASCLFSNSPWVSVGLPRVGSVLSYTHWCQWGCAGGIRRKIWLLIFLFSPCS